MSHTLFLNLLAKKITGEATPEQLQELEGLMKTNPDWAYQAEQIQNLWQYKNGSDTRSSELAFEQHLQKIREAGINFPETASFERGVQNGRSNRKKIFVFSFAAVVVLIVATSVWISRERKNDFTQSKKYSEVSSPIGSKTKLILPDSTIVWLNAGSKLTYDEHFSITNRNATLIGEAFFEVKHGTLPFIIHANGVHIKDLGTAFNVKAYPDEKTTETSLIKGEVEITLDQRPGELHILKPNEKLIVANEPEKVITKSAEKKDPITLLGNVTHYHNDDSVIVETSWVENKLIFEDESFADVAKKMERWYGVNMTFANEEVANYRVYGSFTKETIKEALDALKIGFHFNYKMEGNNITIAK
jgi:transmembrane sensor